MPRKAKELSALHVKRLTTPGRYAVGGVSGLHLQITDSGARTWVLRATVGDKRKDIGLGGFPDVPLEAARQAAREARELIRQGIDPVEHRRSLRTSMIAAGAKKISFSDAAERFIAAKSKEFRNHKHAAQWTSTLQSYAYPKIGRLPVDQVETAHIVQVLEPIWLVKTETASRLRGRLESVLAWATVAGYRTGDNPARWKHHLDKILPAPSKVRKVEHFRALPIDDVPAFMVALRDREGIAARALEFLILTVARSSEVRHATWPEIDLDEKLWTVPAERMKSGKKHRVPLSADAVSLLKALPRFKDSDLVFTAPRGGALSDVAMLAVMKRMEIDATPHGFRSTFKDWCRSRTSYADEVSELALAHVNSDSTRSAYARDELLPKRARLMRDWAKFCRTPQKQGAVTPLRGQK